MPELPEVETIRRQLAKLIVGKKIKKVEIKLPKIVKASLADFRRAVVGVKIRRVDRRAKLIIFGLDNGWSLLVHLKMTGQLVYVKKTVVIPAKAELSSAKAGIQDSGSPRIKYGASLVKPARHRYAQALAGGPGMTNQKHTHVIFNFTDGSRLLFNDL
ncbi:hypothetical protein KJ590_02950, partial [Patescibacteria group bacterium]|nr:hypothetical protein [Patescibacteria group bacterium]